jgi:hypothetical protein
MTAEMIVGTAGSERAMADISTNPSRTDPSTGREVSGWAVGWIIFASCMMIMIGVFHAIAGLVAIVDDGFYVVAPEYVFQFDATTWGWIHLLVGIAILVSGLYLFTGAVLARTVGVIMAIISAIIGFTWLPWYPVWGIVIVAMAIGVIWALTAHGRELAEG